MSTLESRIQAAREKSRSLRRLEQFGLRRTWNGFYYISHYYPLRAQKEISAEDAAETVRSLAGSTFETYIHFPFCEQLCTFCHFYKELDTSDFAAKEDEILSAVEAEMQMYKELLGGPINARSLQIGGGTPSLISNTRLVRLLENVRQCMSFKSGAELKIELYPKVYDKQDLAEKLSILRDFGFTDLVIDLESGHQPTLDFIMRRNSSLQAYLDLVDTCVKEGFKSVVTALMMGLPHETFESLETTLQAMMSRDEIKVINTFPTIYRTTDTISRQLTRRPDLPRDSEERDAMWLYARDLFRSKGYTEGPISYMHHPDKRPDQQADKFECVNLIGFGVSAFGYLNGPDWAGQYFNYCNKPDYLRRIREGKLAMWRLGRYGQAERARRKVIFGLANIKTESLKEIESRFGVSIDEIYGRELNALHELGLIEIDREGGGVRYTEDGLCRLEELTYFLSSDYVKGCCDRLPEKSSPHYKELINQHYFATIPWEDRDKLEGFIRQQPGTFMSRLNA